MSKKIIYFSAAAGVVCILAAGTAAAQSTYAPHYTETMQHFHQGKFSSEKGEFKMSQNNVNDDTLWEKTKEMSAKAWEATKDGTAKVWDKTKELGSDAWDKTKELSGNASETVADKSEDAWEATKEAADDAGDALSGDRYDNPMYDPKNKNAEAHYNHHADN